MATGAALLVTGAALAVAQVSGAQEAPAGGLGGFTATARAHVVRVLFDTPGALPVGPLLELTAPESRVGLATGDTGTAFAAIGYPGPVIAGLPQIIAATGNELPELPPYPFAVEASTSGPHEVLDTTAVPGSSMRAVARGGRVEADTRAPAVGLPEILSIGSLRSVATTVHEDTVESTSLAETADVDLLGGMIRIGALRSTAAAASDGRRPTGDARTVVDDATFLGAPAVITVDGIELADGGGVRNEVLRSLLEPLGGPDGLLAATGLRIRAGAVSERLGGESASTGAEGLTLEVSGALDTSALEGVLASLPPLPRIEGSLIQPADAIGILGANQVRSITIAQATTQLTARAAGAGSDVGGGLATTGGLPLDVGLGGTGAGNVPVDELGTPLPDADAGTDARTGASPAPPGRAPAGGLPLPPLPASGALVALGGGLLASVGMRRFADVALTPPPAAPSCAPTHPEVDT